MNSEYSSSLAKEGRDLVAQASRLEPVVHRDSLVERVLRLVDEGFSVLLLGAPGVGKTAIVHGVAKAMAARKSGGLVEATSQIFLTGTKYLGEWPTKFASIREELKTNKSVLFLHDVWNLETAGASATDGTSVLDVARGHISTGEMQLLGEVTPQQLRKMGRVPGFTRLFQVVEVPALGAAQCRELVLERAAAKGQPIDGSTVDALLQLTRRFLPASAPPGPALNLLMQVLDYRRQKQSVGEDEPISAAFVERVFSIYSGLPQFVVSRNTPKSIAEIRSWFHERIVGQREAVETVVESIALFSAGLDDPKKPTGTFLFVGPTGVGKTELARAMATFLFGKPSRLLRFDLSEFKDYHGFQMLVGDPSAPHRPALLLDPVRAQPFQVILFDELEKAHSNVSDLLLQLLDEGRLSGPSGSTVDFTNTFVIATSNVGAKAGERDLGFGEDSAKASAQRREARVRAALEEEFRPEFINRFQHLAIFHPLNAEHLRAVARHELRSVLSREGIRARNLIVDVDDEALDHVIRNGLDPRFGARAIKRELQRQLVLPLATTLVERQVEDGQLVRVSVRSGQIQVRVADTEASRTAAREARPVELEGGRKVDAAEIERELAAAQASIEAIAEGLDEPFMHEQSKHINAVRHEHGFWNDSQSASRDLADLDYYSETIHRLDRLRSRATEIREELGAGTVRAERVEAAAALSELLDDVSLAHRELLTLGRDGRWDAIVRVTPIPPDDRARDFVADVLLDWAKHRHMTVEWICEPRAGSEGEPCTFLVRGHFPYGYLARESGVHRLRKAEKNSAARVRVVPWDHRRGKPRISEHRALKAKGARGGKIRSRLVCDDGFVFQNAKTLTENQEWAAELHPAIKAEATFAAQDVVRRYDLDQPIIRDAAIDLHSGRLDLVKPERFHRLLCSRIEALPTP